MTIQSKTRGQRMKITGATAPAVTLTPQGPAAAPAPAPAASAAPLQAETLQPAKDAMAAMPEIDHARVAELRDLLAKGELPFDAGRLAGLIQRFHGGKP
jgi:negative regulator of flagellin synthesis FlgM